MIVRTGTSGFAYATWKGTFYPRDLPARRMLSAYAERLAAVEVNATFHRIPSADTVASWRAQVPAGFVFALKAPQQVTHFRRLRGTEGAVSALLRAAAELGATLGPVLFQLPPTFAADVPLLRAFLATLPRGVRTAFEFRHASWLADEVLEALASAGAALCALDAEDREVPVLATTGFGYLRLRRPSYDDADLRRWAARILAQPWSDALVFFKHEDEARGPAFALRMAAVIAAETGTSATPGPR